MGGRTNCCNWGRSMSASSIQMGKSGFHLKDSGHYRGAMIENEKRLLKAKKLLEKAVELLQETESTVVLNRAKAALASADVAARRIGKRKKEAVQAGPPKVYSMPRNRRDLVRGDGTLRFLSYMKPAGKRPAVVAVSFRLLGLPPLTTTFTLDGREFNEVYEAAVSALAKHIGVSKRRGLVVEMLGTREAFLKRFNF